MVPHHPGGKAQNHPQAGLPSLLSSFGHVFIAAMQRSVKKEKEVLSSPYKLESPLSRVGLTPLVILEMEPGTLHLLLLVAVLRMTTNALHIKWWGLIPLLRKLGWLSQLAYNQLNTAK